MSSDSSPPSLMLQRPARKISKWAKFKEVALITSIVVKSAVKQTLREKLPLPKSLDEIFIRYLIYPEMTNVLRPTLTSAPHNSVNMEEEKGCDDIINTASYNYVGLAKLDSTCVEFLRRIIQETPGCGFAVSPTIDSALTYHLNELLEQEIMKFTGKEAAIITASGYMANTATLREIASKDTIVILDALSHNSMWSGFKASGAQLKKFKHNSIENLELLLKQAHKAALSKSPNGSDKTIGDFRSKKSTKNLEEETDNFSLLSPNLDVIVAIEGLYSMEGTIPDMLAIQKLKEKYKFKLFVDEAHSFYSLGKTGRGILEHFNLPPDLIDFQVGTFSKGWASIGGFFAANRETIDKIRNQSLYFAQAQITLPVVVSCRLLYCFWAEQDRLKTKLKRLQQMCTYVHSNLHKFGFVVLGEEFSPVIPIIVYRWTTAKQFLLKCRSLGVGVVIAGYPATPFFETRVRLCLTADLSDQEVTTLVSTLHAVGVEMGLIKSLNKQQSSVQLLLLKPFSEDSSVGGSITSNTNDSPELLAPATLVKIEDLITKVIEYSHQSYPKNDYFGLSRSSPRTIQATLEAFDSLHLGSCGPAIFYGTFKTHVQLQERIAALFGTESASVFSSSFNGTVSIVGAAAQRLLFGQRHVILCDEMVNRQIRLGLDKRSRKVELVFFKHNDVADFEAQLAKIVKGPSKGGKGVFITVCLEAVFRRTGTIPPLDRYNALLVGKSNDDNGGGTNNKKNKNQKKIEFRYLVNEEQSLGMLKHTSSGTNIKNWSLLSHHGIEISNSKISNHIFYGSLSHALCSQGGWVTGSYKDIVTLCSTNVAYFFSANSPPVSATVALENLNRLVDDHEVLQQQLQARVEVIQQNLDTGLSCCSPVCVIRLKEEKGVEGEKQGIKSLMDSIIDKWGRLIQMERGEDEVEGRDLRIFLSASIPLNTLQAFAEEMKQWCIMKKQ